MLPTSVTLALNKSKRWCRFAQVHDPEFAPFTDIIVEETLPALFKLKEAGKVKMIGMTGAHARLPSWTTHAQRYACFNLPWPAVRLLHSSSGRRIPQLFNVYELVAVCSTGQIIFEHRSFHVDYPC
jgi:hypothetical protein